MKGTFQITSWDEKPYLEADDGSKKSHATITQSYSGDIEGSSELQYLMSYQSAGSAVFVGFEVINCTIQGKSGSFTVQHDGKFEAGIASSFFSIVTNSGTDELVDITGTGTFTSGEAGQAHYQFELTI